MFRINLWIWSTKLEISMKNILIVSSSLVMGGLEKCFINLCDNLDYDKYQVDLYLFNEGRDLVSKLNKNVHLLEESTLYYDVYNKPFFKSIKTLLKKKKFGLLFYRIGRFIRSRLKCNKFTVNDFKNMKKTMLKIDKHYDVAIGFEEGTACYYVADCVDATVKIGWIHTDLKEVNPNVKLDDMAFSKMNAVATVSNNSLNSLCSLYPKHKDKFKCIYIPRLLNYDEIDRLSNEENNMRKNGINILSVGRLVELKGFHLCVPVLKKLIDDGYDACWYVAGEGEYRIEIEKEIEKYGVKDRFILLGNCANPYTYIKSSTICVQPSSYEGQSVVILEEKYFNKAVVVTNISSNLEMICDHKNGITVDRNVEAIYNGVKELLSDEKLLTTLAKEPVLGPTDNDEIIRQIEQLF